MNEKYLCSRIKPNEFLQWRIFCGSRHDQSIQIYEVDVRTEIDFRGKKNIEKNMYRWFTAI